MAKINEAMINEIIKLVGGKNNIAACGNCMTRLRLGIKDGGLVDKEGIKKVDNVLTVIETEEQLQIVLGPGKAQTAAELMRSMLGDGIDDASPSLEEVAQVEKSERKAKQTHPIQRFLATFATIFTPLIPGFIGVGLLVGIGTLVEQILLNSSGATAYMTANGLKAININMLMNEAFQQSEFATQFITSNSWPLKHIVNIVLFLQIFGKSMFAFMGLLIGYNAQKAFGGTGVYGAVIAGFFVFQYNPEKAGMVAHMLQFPFSDGPISANGAVIGVLIACYVGAHIEKIVRKFIPDSLDMILTSSITLLLMGILTYTLIMPSGAVLAQGISWLFENLNGNPFGASILSGVFLITVVFGIHQGFIPVYEALFQSQGFNSLFPILAVAGAGQVGAAIALYVRAGRESLLRKQIKGAIIPGFLGIGEPLIYGVTLPRLKPFITACFGGAAGGFFIGYIAYLGTPMGLNSVFGPSGILGIPFMTTGDSIITGIFIYSGGLLTAYVFGFILTYFFGSKNVDLS